MYSWACCAACGRPWTDFGILLVTRVALWLPLGAPFGSLWLPLGALGLPSGVIWVAFGCQWPSLGPLLPSWGSLGAPGSIWIPFSEEMLLKYRACAQNLAFWNLPADAADAAEPPEVVSASAAQTPPSTRAGGQDDGSTQTPLNHLCSHHFLQ